MSLFEKKKKKKRTFGNVKNIPCFTIDVCIHITLFIVIYLLYAMYHNYKNVLTILILT